MGEHLGLARAQLNIICFIDQYNFLCMYFTLEQNSDVQGSLVLIPLLPYIPNSGTDLLDQKSMSRRTSLWATEALRG